MQTDPILASRRLPKGTDGWQVPLTFKVEGGLHYIKGNHAPYFSLTYDQHRAGNRHQCQSGGAGHERILELFPRFAQLAALHLSDIDGVPMHAEANGWYQLAGALGGAGETYHGGNGSSARNTDECLSAFAAHCRIGIDEAADIRDQVRSSDPGWSRLMWAAIMETMRPRWKLEAEAAIETHHLQIFGDRWPDDA